MVNIEERIKNIELFLSNEYEKLLGNDAKRRESHNRNYLIFASLEVVGVWAIAILMFLKA